MRGHFGGGSDEASDQQAPAGKTRSTSTAAAKGGLQIGYARVSTLDEQDLTPQRDGLTRLGVDPSRMYVDNGMTGTHRARPGLREALAACRAGDTPTVTKLDRLARSIADARDIADDLTNRGVKLINLGGSVYDPTDPVGRLLFNVLAMVAEFEGDLIRARTREGMAVAKAKGRLRSKQPKLSPRQEAHLVQLYRAGQHISAELAELFSRRPIDGVPRRRTSRRQNVDGHRTDRISIAAPRAPAGVMVRRDGLCPAGR